MASKVTSRLFAAQVVHTRYKPVYNTFNYPVYYYAFDLDELQSLSERLYIFGYNKKRPVSIWDEDYVVSTHAPEPLKKMIDPKWSIKRKILAYMTAHSIETQNISRVELVTGARYLGKSFNPVSFYFCWNSSNKLEVFVAEVNNTFGERHIYLLPATADLGLDASSAGAYVARFMTNKIFHVSPFNDVSGLYEFKISDISKRISVNINQMETETQNIMSTYLIGHAPYYEITDYNLFKMLAKYPVTALLTMPRITFEAFKLHYKLHLRVYAKPPPQSTATIGLIEPSWAQSYAKENALPLLATKFGDATLSLPNQTSIQLGTFSTTSNLVVNILSWDFFCVLHERGCNIPALMEAFVAGYFETAHLFDVIGKFESPTRKSVYSGPVPMLGYVCPVPITESPRPPPFINSSFSTSGASKDSFNDFKLQSTDHLLLLASSSTIGKALHLLKSTQARCTVVCSPLDVSAAALGLNVATLTYDVVFKDFQHRSNISDWDLSVQDPFTHILAPGTCWQSLVSRFGSEKMNTFLLANSRPRTTIILYKNINNGPSIQETSQKRASGFSPRVWIDSALYNWDKAKQQFSGELLDVITTYILNPFQVDSRTKEILYLHGIELDKSRLPSLSPTEVLCRGVSETDVTVEAIQDLQNNLDHIITWWNDLKSQKLPATSPEWRWNVEELRVLIFHYVSILGRLTSREMSVKRVMLERV